MAYKQQDNPNVDHTNHSSNSEFDSVDSSRSETDAQETITAGVLETRSQPLPRDDFVRREGQSIDTGSISKDMERLNIYRSDVKDLQSATINPSGDDLLEGKTNSPVQPLSLELEERNTIGSRALAQQSLREDSEVTKLRSEFEEFKRSVNSNAEEVEDLKKSLIEMKSAYEEGISKLQSNLETSWSEFKRSVNSNAEEVEDLQISLMEAYEEGISKLQSNLETSRSEFKRSVNSNAEEVEDLQISLIEVKSAYEEGISKLQSNLEAFQKTVMDIVVAVSEMRTNLIDMESANAAERETLKKTMEETMRQLVSLLAQQMKGMCIDTGSLPDDKFHSLWRDFLSQPDDNFKQGGFVNIDPRIISCKFSIGPSKKALIYVRESFEGLWKCIGGQADELPASMTTATPLPTTGPGNKFLITGTPGTGKSCFAYYLLPHLLAKEGNSVLYQNCHKDMKFFVVITRSKDSEYEIEHHHMPNNSLPKPMLGFLKKGKDSVEKRVSWYIFDSGHKSGAKPESTDIDVSTIVISSPDCGQYKDFLQMCPEKFYMPTWEWREIDDVVRKLHPNESAEMDATIQRAQADFGQEAITKKEKKEREEKAFQSFTELARANAAFLNHGGVMREILNPCSEGRLEALHAAIDQSSVEMVLKFLHASGDVPSTVSHRILHLLCDKKVETLNERRRVTVDYQNHSIDFASPYVQDRFWSLHQNKIAYLHLDQLSLIYDVAHEGCRSKIGEKFEDLVHETLTAGEYVAKQLLPKPEITADAEDADKTKPKQPPPMTTSISLNFDSKKKREVIRCEKTSVCTIVDKPEDKTAYVRPNNKAFPAIDAFLPGQQYLLQITVAKNHPVAVPELLDFIRHPARRWKLEETTLVFVVLDRIYDNFQYQDPSKPKKTTKKKKPGKESEEEKEESEKAVKLSPEEIIAMNNLNMDFKKIKQYVMPWPKAKAQHQVADGH